MSTEKPIVKRIVCLANSDRWGNRCVAGKVINKKSTDWIRPVSARTDGGILEQECQYENGGLPQLLDIIDVPLLKERPEFHQKENWLLDTNSRWKKRGCMSWCDLEQLTDHAPLWIAEQSRHKNNDRFKFLEAKNLKDSLRLIRVNELTFYVAYSSGQRKMRGKFCYNGIEHDLSVTDPEWRKLTGKFRESCRIGDSFLTVSLTGCMDRGYCYLLIAGIIPCDKVSRA